jgi:hypothetical protein
LAFGQGLDLRWFIVVYIGYNLILSIFLRSGMKC